MAKIFNHGEHGGHGEIRINGFPLLEGGIGGI